MFSRVKCRKWWLSETMYTAAKRMNMLLSQKTEFWEQLKQKRNSSAKALGAAANIYIYTRIYINGQTGFFFKENSLASVTMMMTTMEVSSFFFLSLSFYVYVFSFYVSDNGPTITEFKLQKLNHRASYHAHQSNLLTL